MQILGERRGQHETRRIDEVGGLFAILENETNLEPRRTERHGYELAHGCGGCGENKPGVDLWAEDRETGEELWLCEACGEW